MIDAVVFMKVISLIIWEQLWKMHTLFLMPIVFLKDALSIRKFGTVPECSHKSVMLAIEHATVESVSTGFCVIL